MTGAASNVHPFDIVALLRDRKELGLAAGEIGTVVEVYGGGEAYEIEFVDDRGQTYALETFRADEILRLHVRGQPYAYQSTATLSEDDADADHAPAGASVRPEG